MHSCFDNDGVIYWFSGIPALMFAMTTDLLMPLDLMESGI
jgi:hypothetical protein